MSVQLKIYETVRKCTIWLQRDIIRPLFTSPAAWCFAAVWAAAAIYLVAIGRSSTVLWCFFSYAILIFMVLCVITVGITSTEHKTKLSYSRARLSLLLLQIVAIVFFISITGYTSLMFHGVREFHPIPVWSAIIRAFSNLGERLFSADIVGHRGLAMANPAKYFLLPLMFLLLLGAHFSELGFRRGHRTLVVLALWCFVPICFWVFQLTSGYLTFGVLSCRLLGHLLQNGFSEEFLFRGALQTRLRLLLTPSWAIIIQALLFGIWHFAANAAHFESMGVDSNTVVIASCILRHATAGLIFGIIFERTRNLLACSVIHVVINSLGG